MVIERFAGIKAVALFMAEEAETCHEEEFTEEEFLTSLDPVLGAEGVYEDDLAELDSWCRALSPEEQKALACGEGEEIEAVMESCPRPDMAGLFNDIFEACFPC